MYGANQYLKLIFASGTAALTFFEETLRNIFGYLDYLYSSG